MRIKVILFIITVILCIVLGPFGCRESKTSEMEERIKELEEELSEQDSIQGAAEEESEYVEGVEDDSETEESIEDAEAEVSGGLTTDDEGVEPTISLAIYQDATYSAADDICYYRIEANITGNPSPSVSWSKDDSMESFGNRIAQVNLRRGEAYTLIATATNSVGTATDSITLAWGCDGEEVAEEDEDIGVEADEYEEEVAEEEDEDAGRGSEDGSVGPSEGSVSIGAVTSISGSRNSAGITIRGNTVRAGDDTFNYQVKGFISWDIRELHGVTVTDAEIMFLNLRIVNWPQGIGENLVVKELNYGAAIDSSDYDVGGTFLANIPISEGSATISNSTLINKLQEAIDSGRYYFQIKIGLDGTVLADDLADQVYIDDVSTEAGLYIGYTD